MNPFAVADLVEEVAYYRAVVAVDELNTMRSDRFVALLKVRIDELNRQVTRLENENRTLRQRMTDYAMVWGRSSEKIRWTYTQGV